MENSGILPLDEAEQYRAKLWNGGQISENDQSVPFYIMTSAISDAGRIHMDADASKYNCCEKEPGPLIFSDAGRIQLDAGASSYSCRWSGITEQSRLFADAGRIRLDAGASDAGIGCGRIHLDAGRIQTHLCSFCSKFSVVSELGSCLAITFKP